MSNCKGCGAWSDTSYQPESCMSCPSQRIEYCSPPTIISRIQPPCSMCGSTTIDHTQFDCDQNRRLKETKQMTPNKDTTCQ